MKLFGSKKTIEETNNRENVLNLEMLEVVSVQCNMVDDQCQQKSEVLYTYTPK